MTRLAWAMALILLAMLSPYARASDHRQVFNVGDFGAVANSSSDSGPAIRKAIDAAVLSGHPADVVLGDGTYRLGSITDGAWWPKAHLVISGAKDLVLRGSGKTVLVMTDPGAAGVVLLNCDKIVAQRLTIDYDPVPQVLSKIVAIDPDHNFIEVEREAGDPDLLTYDQTLFQEPGRSMLGTTYEVRPDGSVAWGLVPVGLTMAGQTGPCIYKLTTPPNPAHTRRDAIAVAGLHVGDLFVTSAGGNTGAAFSMIKNKNAEARQITLHASPGLAFFPFNDDSVSLIGCIVEIKPGSHRALSTAADGIHARGNRHIVIEGCSIAGTGDDAINLHSSAAVPLSRQSPTGLIFRGATYSIRPGDTLEQARPETGLVIGRYLVKSVDDTHRYEVRVEFSEPIGDVNFGTNLATGDQFFDLNEANNDFVVRNNTIGTHRGRDLLISAYKGLVEGNHFNNRRRVVKPVVASSDPASVYGLDWGTGLSIVMCYDTGWGEGPLAEGITIRDNVFTGFETKSPAIWIGDALRGGVPQSNAGSHKDIVIEGNTFKNRNISAVIAHFVTNLVVKNNKVIGRGMNMSATPNVPAFDLRNCTGVEASGNLVEEDLFTMPVDIGK